MVKKAGRYVLIFLSLCSPAFNAQSGFSAIEDYMDRSRHYDQVEVNSFVAYGKAYQRAQALKDYDRLRKTVRIRETGCRNNSGDGKATVCHSEGTTAGHAWNTMATAGKKVRIFFAHGPETPVICTVGSSAASGEMPVKKS